MADFVRRFFVRRFAGQVATGAPTHESSLLLQDGFYLLQEDGSSTILLQ
jgi:hypothetical protein